MSRRFSTQKDLRVEEEDLVPGRVLWLPMKEDLPARAVRRAHGKGAVEEGIYNHPVVVISRPGNESQTIHFHIITSFQGKRLHEIYSKSNEFHASRRSWYLPISPSPEHPDVTSKKTRKRFPTLDLASGAILRWDSYVNLRHIYGIEWSHLRPYSNPDTPERLVFRFDRESTVRLLAKGKTLTNYEPGQQYSRHTQPRARPSLARVETAKAEQPRNDAAEEAPEHEPRSPKSDTDSMSVVSSEYSALSPILQSDFGIATKADRQRTSRPPKVPPDRKESRWVFVRRILWCLLKWPLALEMLAVARTRSSNNAARYQVR
ncbi:hypothetical protein P280DRAFT_395488 [Massarina eburnea CBS 473.64]|uniref:Uncharacterized protein n=1 Tax=Massarina eburnea CBS 473.64 TaxID=1395130 RepID=A0A6A6S2Z4_9PLEO|nr:hypothetical protein P280DRAFT_395488 [Massarina eburnea CBS 473.64]